MKSENCMDITVSPSHKSRWAKYRWFLIGSICLIASSVLFVMTSKASTVVEQDSLSLDKVMIGPLTVSIEAFGKLQSARQQTLTTLSSGVVTHVAARAGQAVTRGDVIVTLKNDDLILERAKLQQQLGEIKVHLEQQKILQRRELLAEQAALKEVEGDLASLQFRYQAQSDLAQQGVISKYAFFQTQASRDSATEQLAHAKKRIAQLHQLHRNELAMTGNKIALKEQELTALRNKIAALTVRAPNDGVVEHMPLGLGESVQSGGYIATIGDQRDLTAALQVAQGDVQKVQLGQSVKVKIGDDMVAAKVTRIDPVVNNHSVLVEAKLPSELPSAARPKLNIEASIIIEHLHDVVYIRRPANRLTIESGLIYKVLDQGKTELVAATFGIEAGRHMVVEEGLSVGQTVIISDLHNLAQQGSSVVIE
ncbi:efflux RND transporter periplasmic adaptor subunit [Pseudoalteromonas luteoviolacea]|uniref:efflux RND transporter periplasmic adaptor subunit n=1 Tax=Pseudoalteromonas luteoviolacea TaxID=43657 RepID=UPI001150B175|nr:HlyD family efflux transporter periplasmic adaptor subunit [Pseudoalteromonas luteoviolacea]TQF72503.1 HlyD family efflux transporter periplasmic adaptor subunit [Pseudoalteromonas luteoviolacea]